MRLPNISEAMAKLDFPPHGHARRNKSLIILKLEINSLRMKKTVSSKAQKPKPLSNKHHGRGVVFALHDVADDKGLFFEALEAQEHVGFLFGGNGQHQTDAVVEGAEHFGEGDVAQ